MKINFIKLLCKILVQTFLICKAIRYKSINFCHYSHLRVSKSAIFVNDRNFRYIRIGFYCKNFKRFVKNFTGTQKTLYPRFRYIRIRSKRELLYLHSMLAR